MHESFHDVIGVRAMAVYVNAGNGEPGPWIQLSKPPLWPGPAVDGTAVRAAIISDSLVIEFICEGAVLVWLWQTWCCSRGAVGMHVSCRFAGDMHAIQSH